MELSIVTTLYNSEKFIPHFIEKFVLILKDIGINKNEYEIIMVNDGSPDSSLKVAVEFKQKYSDVNIKILDLSRNFGHHNAFFSGISEAKGNYVFLIDSDMEVEPNCLKIFYNKIKSDENIDVVYGYLPNRKSTINEKLSDMFWVLINKLSNTNIPRNITTERIFSRVYVDALCKVGDFNLFLGGLFYWVGFNQVGIPLERSKKRAKSNYNLRRKLDLFINAVTSFSSFPLFIIFYLSIIFCFISGIYLLFIILRKLFYPETVLIGFSSLSVFIVFIGSLIVFCISIIGLYIAKIYDQTKNRPRFIIKKIY